MIILKQLSLHYLNQMEYAMIEQIKNGDAVGYIIINNIRIGLIKYQNDYFKLNLDIIKNESTSKQWWSIFSNIKDKCLMRHLYYEN